MTRPAPRYLTLRIPREPWPLLRALTVSGMLALAVVCWTEPSTGLPVLWGLVVPALPLVWVLAPGLWRNVCPMASVNQLPRITGLTRGLTLPPWLERHGFTIGMVTFFTTVSLRPSLLQTDGHAAAVMLVLALVAAFIGGTIYRGKSGFCGSVCPLRPTQAVYSRAPGATVEHAHCRPCIGCTTNCQDIIPAKSFLSDLASGDGRGDARWIFAGLLPGFIYAFGVTPVGTAWGTSIVSLGAWALLSLGLLTAAESLTRLGRGRLTALWGAASLGLFYWTATAAIAAAVDDLAGVSIGDAAVWEGRGVIALVVAAWLGRSLRLARPAVAPAAAPAARREPTGLELPVFDPAVATSPAPAVPGRAATAADRRGLAEAVEAAMADVSHAPADVSQLEVPHGARPTEASAAPVIAGEPPVQIPDRRGPGRPDRAPTIIFWPDGSAVPVPPHEPTIAAAARSVGIDLPEGCGTGLCGCDPVYVLSGAESIAPAGEQERATLQRLGLPSHARLACAARVTGDVVISLEETAEQPTLPAVPAAVPAQPVMPAASLHAQPAHAAVPVRPEAPRPAQPAREPVPAAPAPVHARAGSPASLEEVGRIVIVGNGVSGITAASHVRRLHPGCSIDVVSRSAHPFYNRIAIARLIHRPQGLGSLQLMPDRWYEQQRVAQWLNTSAIALDRDRHELVLGTGQALPYDKLILAPGARWAKPNLPGIDQQGVFGVREAADAIGIRAYAQDARVRTAVVLGGGLLGLEMAEAMVKIGLDVTVVERARHLAGHVLDEPAARLVRRSVEGAGIRIRLETSVSGLRGADGRLTGVVLDDGEVVPAELAVVCVGISPEVGLAREAGLDVRRGIVVDEHMRTSDPAILACGDAAEFDGLVGGHWAIGAAQAEVAAVTAVGGVRSFSASPVPTVLKLDHLRVLSVGDIRGHDKCSRVLAHAAEDDRYQVTIMDGARPVGLIAVNAGGDVDPIVDSIVHGRPLPDHVDPRGLAPASRGILREVS